jgi:DNA-binding NtrC family response regulator
MHKVRILIYDSGFGLREGLHTYFSRKEFIVFQASDPSEANMLLEEYPINILLADMTYPQESTISLVRSVNRKYTDIEVLIVGGKDKVVFAEKTGSFGSTFYISTPIRWSEIQTAIENTKAYQEMRKHLAQLDINFSRFTEEITMKGGQPIIGVSSAIKSITSLMLLVGCTDDTSVMITGESGTGKELVARGIHMISSRTGGPFHGVNCSAIPDALFESEFFGYSKGAFTGAIEKSVGWFELANTGTLFLDEVTELPLSMQSKFLRVLDDKKIHKISSHQEISLSVRVISATNQDITGMLNKGTFRSDLFHRLDSFHIHIPPLRERREDIPVLLQFFVSEISRKLKKPEKPIEDEAMDKITNYYFPGNVRELKNMVERAVIFSQDNTLKCSHFCTDFKRNSAPVPTGNLINSLSLQEVEMRTIAMALKQANNNKSKAAALLSISRQALDRKITKFNIICS